MTRWVHSFPWLCFGLGTVVLLLALALGIFGFGGGSIHDASPTVTRTFLVAGAIYGVGATVWPFLPTFVPAVAAWYGQTHIGDSELPGWVLRLSRPTMVAGGLFLVLVSISAWPR